MRIAFLAAEYPDVPVERGRVRIGSGPDNGLVLDASSGILPMHMQIDVDPRRGVVLAVLDPDAKVWLNGRPVREKALLRPGDLIVAGKVRMQIKADEDPPAAPPAGLEGAQAASLGPTTPLLRGMAGRFVGRMVYLPGETTLGSAAPAQVVLDQPDAPAAWLRIQARQGKLAVYAAEGSPAVSINGVDVRSALLEAGDQLAFENDRFVIEAPGWGAMAERPAQISNTQVVAPLTPRAEPTTPAAASASAQAESAGEATVDWIILAAAVVTIVALATLVYLQFWG